MLSNHFPATYAHPAELARPAAALRRRRRGSACDDRSGATSALGTRAPRRSRCGGAMLLLDAEDVAAAPRSELRAIRSRAFVAVRAVITQRVPALSLAVSERPHIWSGAGRRHVRHAREHRATRGAHSRARCRNEDHAAREQDRHDRRRAGTVSALDSGSELHCGRNRGGRRGLAACSYA